MKDCDPKSIPAERRVVAGREMLVVYDSHYEDTLVPKLRNWISGCVGTLPRPAVGGVAIVVLVNLAFFEAARGLQDAMLCHELGHLICGNDDEVAADGFAAAFGHGTTLWRHLQERQKVLGNKGSYAIRIHALERCIG